MLNPTKQIWNFLVKRTCITNHKQIGTVYTLLGSFSGMVLSMAIRFELAHEGELIFKGSAQTYSVVIVHALFKIFSKYTIKCAPN